MAAASTSSIPGGSISTSSLGNSPTLLALVPHLLAARRSLSCVEQVSQANSLIRASRQAIESQTALAARVLYIRNSSQAQAHTLDKVTQYVQDINIEVQKEWEEIVNRVDEARQRLAYTVETLKQTKVEEKLRGSVVSENEIDEQDTKDKHFLIDFVDETGFMTLLENIKQSGRVVSEAKEEYDQSIETLLDEVSSVKLSIQSVISTKSFVGDDGLDNPTNSMRVLQEMEQGAGEMAKNLESLVKHFDLCITAIKHTEGGGAAMTKIAKDLPGELDLNIGHEEEPLENIGEDEMQEIRAVIEKDAAEVEDVIAEIKAGMEEVELCGSSFKSYGFRLKEDFRLAVSGFRLLEEVGQKLPSYITQAQLFAYKWEEERLNIEEYLIDLDGLKNFYANFIDAYDNLLIEVGRRKDVEKRINKIRKEAMARIDNLISEEIEERKTFKGKQGDFLPVDIWPGLTLPPSRYEFVKVDEIDESSVPDISASVINRAIKRVSQSNKGK